MILIKLKVSDMVHVSLQLGYLNLNFLSLKPGLERGSGKEVCLNKYKETMDWGGEGYVSPKS